MKPISSRPANLKELPADKPENRETRDQVAIENLRCANHFVFAAATTTADGVRFKCTLAVPDKLSWPKIVVRAYAESSADCAQGVLVLAVAGDG